MVSQMCAALRDHQTRSGLVGAFLKDSCAVVELPIIANDSIRALVIRKPAGAGMPGQRGQPVSSQPGLGALGSCAIAGDIAALSDPIMLDQSCLLRSFVARLSLG